MLRLIKPYLNATSDFYHMCILISCLFDENMGKFDSSNNNLNSCYPATASYGGFFSCDSSLFLDQSTCPPDVLDCMNST